MAKYVDFAEHSKVQKDFNYYAQSFILHPEQLLGLSLPVSLEWHHTRFTKAHTSSIVEAPGIYALVIRHDGSGLPPHGYVAYIGQTGAERRHRTLRDRFKDYLGEKVRPKRPRIFELLNKWEKCLFFYFAPVDTAKTDLLQIEQRLNDAMIPPYSHQDFSVEIRKAKRIWEAS